MTELRKLSSENLLIKAGDYRLLMLSGHMNGSEMLKVQYRHIICYCYGFFFFSFYDYLMSCSDCREQLSLWIVQPASL